MSCGSCLFVLVLSVLSLSRLPPWRGFLPRLTWTHPPFPPSPHQVFCFHLSLRRGGLNSAHGSLNTGLVLHILLSFRCLFPFFCCVCHRFAPSLLKPNTWFTGFFAEHLYTHNLSKYGLFQSLSQYGLFQNPGLHTCFGLNLNRGLNKTNVFASKPSFTQRAVLHKNHVLIWPAQGLFAAYRIALSMVAGGTRRRRLNNYGETPILWSDAMPVEMSRCLVGSWPKPDTNFCLALRFSKRIHTYR